MKITIRQLKEAISEVLNTHDYVCRCASCCRAGDEQCSSCGSLSRHGCPDGEYCENPACVAERNE